MSPELAMRLADAVLLVHLAVILFNIFGLVVIPLGAWRGWAFVRILWWRALHLGILAVVALQAVFERACFLTVWQSELVAHEAAPAPLIRSWVGRLIFWPLPLWFFALLYLAVWIYALVLWWKVPPHYRQRPVSK